MIRASMSCDEKLHYFFSHFFSETKYETNAKNQVVIIECSVKYYAYKEHAVLVIQFSQHEISIHTSVISNICRYNILGAFSAENS
jgi:hypothetical protein